MSGWSAANIITVSSVIALVAFLWKVATDTAKTIQNSDMITNKKIGRVYERMDEVQELTERKYVRNDICVERVKNLTEDVSEIKMDVKKLLTKNGFK